MFYDFIIVGGGIGGLYTAYKLNKCSPEKKILIIEKSGTLGGRVYTYHDSYMDVEAGAGRFSDKHHLLLELIRELKLSNKMMEHTGGVVFAPSDYTNSIQPSLMENPLGREAFEKTGFVTPIYNRMLDIYLGEQNMPSSGLITKVVLASQLESRETLQKMSFVEYASKVLSKEEIEYIKQTFGYYSELVIMNSYDAIQLMNSLGPSNTFYGLRGGISQIIERMEQSIRKNPNHKILKNHEVKKITPLFGEMGGTGFQIDVFDKATSYYGKKCVCALPKQVLEKLKVFQPIKKMLEKIECGSLCRIYSQFDKGKNGKVWFHDLPKLTTDNELRMVIPIDTKQGSIMISYTDNKYAEFWRTLYEKKGVREVNRQLKEKMRASLGIEIPMPKHTKVFYWKCGVGYWGIGADSHEISNRMTKPFPDIDLFVCGEHYSEKNQQWMEGALETSSRVLRLL
jgi:monoamine oxidase